MLHRGSSYYTGHTCSLENAPAQLGEKVGGKNKELENCKHFFLFLHCLFGHLQQSGVNTNVRLNVFWLLQLEFFVNRKEQFRESINLCALECIAIPLTKNSNKKLLYQLKNPGKKRSLELGNFVLANKKGRVCINGSYVSFRSFSLSVTQKLSSCWELQFSRAWCLFCLTRNNIECVTKVGLLCWHILKCLRIYISLFNIILFMQLYLQFVLFGVQSVVPYFLF